MTRVRIPLGVPHVQEARLGSGGGCWSIVRCCHVGVVVSVATLVAELVDALRSDRSCIGSSSLLKGTDGVTSPTFCHLKRPPALAGK